MSFVNVYVKFFGKLVIVVVDWFVVVIDEV